MDHQANTIIAIVGMIMIIINIRMIIVIANMLILVRGDLYGNRVEADSSSRAVTL